MRKIVALYLAISMCSVNGSYYQYVRVQFCSMLKCKGNSDLEKLMWGLTKALCRLGGGENRNVISEYGGVFVAQREETGKEESGIDRWLAAIKREEHRLWSWGDFLERQEPDHLDEVSVLLFAGYVILGKLLKLSVPQFPPSINWGNINTMYHIQLWKLS